MCAETCTTDNILDQELYIEGYNIVRCDSSNRYTGGVLMYIQDKIEYEILQKKSNEWNWALAIKVLNGMESGIYSVFYRSPNSKNKIRIFASFFEKFLEDVIDFTKTNLILGDFNINLQKNTSNAKKFKTILNSFNLKQLINECTRITCSSRTMIDLALYFGEKTMNADVLHAPKISDHSIIKMSTKSPGNHNDTSENKITIKSYAKYQKTELIDVLKLCVKDYDNIDENMQSLAKRTTEIVKSMIEEKQVPKQKFEMCKKLKVLQIQRDRSYQKAILSDKEEDWEMYRLNRNIYTRNLKVSESNQIKKNIEKHKKNGKKLWKIIKNMYKSQENDPFRFGVKFQESTVKEKQQIAENMNSFFIKSINEIHASISESPNKDSYLSSIQQNRINSNFKFKQIVVEELRITVGDLKNDSGLENVNKKVLNDIISDDIIGNFFVKIINQSLQEGVFPDCLKTSTIIPVPKVANTIKCEEFRPINMLPTWEKVLEKIVYKQLKEYVEKNSIIIEEQSGFREKHSCETALNLVISDWKDDVDQNKKVISVFLDLKRAFETIDRKILLQKLSSIGIINTERKWFESYLSARKQIVKIGEYKSNELYNNLGVPQGSILAPLLFSIYMNDMPKFVKHGKINLFADDTLITVSDKNIDNGIQNMNENLKSISDWLKINKLKLNVSKTKGMIIYTKNEPYNLRLFLDDYEIETVKSIKYLGIIIDSKLDMQENTSMLTKKIAKKVALLGRLKRKLDVNTRILIYKSIISPHFEYCSSLLFMCTKSQIYKLQKLQNRAMRLILDMPANTSQKWLLDVFQWLSIKQRVYFNTMMLIHKAKMNILPKYLMRRMILVRDCHNINTRASAKGLFRLPKYAKTYSQNSLQYNGIKEYNSLPENFKNCSNLKTCKNILIEYIKVNVL